MASLAELEANLGGRGGGTGTTGLWGRFSLLTVYVLHFFVYHDMWKVLSSKVSLCRALTHHQTREETELSVLELMALQSVLFTLELTTRYPVSHLYDLNYNWSSQCTIYLSGLSHLGQCVHSSLHCYTFLSQCIFSTCPKFIPKTFRKTRDSDYFGLCLSASSRTYLS